MGDAVLRTQKFRTAQASRLITLTYMKWRVCLSLAFRSHSIIIIASILQIFACVFFLAVGPFRAPCLSLASHVMGLLCPECQCICQHASVHSH